VRHVDIAPTLLEIAGIDPTDPFARGLQGVSLERHPGIKPDRRDSAQSPQVSAPDSFA
jgi:arylsulfatase A-like enzyme